jgi:PrtD family type I secretion system ABC transporter
MLGRVATAPGLHGGRSAGARELKAALATRRSHLIGVWLLSALIALLYLAPSIYMLQVYDRVLTTGGLTTLVLMSAFLVVALATHAYLEDVRQRLLVRASLRLDRVLGERLLRGGFALPPDAGPRNRQILREFDTLRSILQGPAATGLFDAPFAPIFVLIGYMLHPLLGALMLGGAAGLLLLSIIAERATAQAQNEANAHAPALYAAAEAAQLQGGAVRALGMQGALAGRMLKQRSAISLLGARIGFTAGGYSAAIRFLRMALQSASLGLGALLAIQGAISPGALIAASILTGRALAPIEQIVGAWRQLGQARSARAAIVTFLDTIGATPARTPLPAPAGGLRAENVSVAAGASQRLVVEDVSFDIGCGEVIGIVGPSGSGKSSLARALVGAQPPASGVVRCDGFNIADWDSDAFGAAIGYLPQDVALFAGTVAENISRFSDADDRSERLIEAAKQAGAHALIQRLPNGYDTPLGAAGLGLSAGQAQRIAMARALFGDPKVIVLDEPNAHLDSEGEASLLATIKTAAARGASIVVITHRLGILSAVDKLLVMRDGKVDRIGPRDQILATLRPPPANSTTPRIMPIASVAP